MALHDAALFSVSLAMQDSGGEMLERVDNTNIAALLVMPLLRTSVSRFQREGGFTAVENGTERTRENRTLRERVRSTYDAEVPDTTAVVHVCVKPGCLQLQARCRLARHTDPLLLVTRRWWIRRVGDGILAGRCQLLEARVELQCIQLIGRASHVLTRCGIKPRKLPVRVPDFFVNAVSSEVP